MQNTSDRKSQPAQAAGVRFSLAYQAVEYVHIFEKKGNIFECKHAGQCFGGQEWTYAPEQQTFLLTLTHCL